MVCKGRSDCPFCLESKTLEPMYENRQKKLVEGYVSLIIFSFFSFTYSLCFTYEFRFLQNMADYMKELQPG